MFKRILLGLLLVILFSGVSMVAAQTSTATATPEGQWCYHFDFTQSEAGFVPSLGEFDKFNGGFRQSAAEHGLLTINYENLLTVFPSRVDIIMQRGPFTSGDINMQIAGNLFGLEIRPEPLFLVIPTDITEEFTLPVSPASASDFSPNATFTADASQYVYIWGLKVYGFGVNPFPTDNCGEPTPTPAPITATASPTIAPTHDGSCLLPGEATPTSTSGPSPTPIWQTLLENFESASPVSSVVTWGSGDGSATRTNYGSPRFYRWVRSAFQLEVFVYVVFTFPYEVTIDHFQYIPTVDGTFSAQHGVERWNGSAWVSVGANGTPSGGYQNNYNVVSGTQFRVWAYASSVNYGSFPPAAALDDVYVHYREANPAAPTLPACTPTPTITPSVSPTATPSRTPTPTPTLLGITPTATRTPTRTPFPIIIPTTAPTSTPRPPTATTAPTSTPHPSLTPFATGTAISTVGPFIPPEAGGSGPGGGLGNAVISFGANAWNRATGWVNESVGAVTRMTDAWNSAVPTAPPTMPRCKSDPFANELCAIWYMLTFSVFNGTLGGLIIPVGLIGIDVYFLFIFFRFVRAIHAQIKQIRRSS